MDKVQAIAFTDNVDTKQIRKDITDNPEKFVQDLLGGSKFGFGVHNVVQGGVYLEMGYKYDLRSCLKQYVYRQYEGWHDIWALNKTNACKLIGGRIQKIIEITE